MTTALASVDLLEEAGFTTLAKRARATALGTTLISKEVVAKFQEKLASRGQQFDIQEINDYQPEGKELIPTLAVKDIAKVNKAGIFDKILVVGTRKLMKREVDPIVVGILGEVPKGHWGELLYENCDWYYIAGWK